MWVKTVPDYMARLVTRVERVLRSQTHFRIRTGIEQSTLYRHGHTASVSVRRKREVWNPERRFGVHGLVGSNRGNVLPYGSSSGIGGIGARMEHVIEVSSIPYTPSVLRLDRRLCWSTTVRIPTQPS